MRLAGPGGPAASYLRLGVKAVRMHLPHELLELLFQLFCANAKAGCAAQRRRKDDKRQSVTTVGQRNGVTTLLAGWRSLPPERKGTAPLQAGL